MDATRWIRLALWMWGILAIALCVKILVEGDRHSVYPAFAGGSRDWWASEVMYDHEGYFYSPTFSVLFTPFAILPNRLGQMVWGLTSMGLFLWSLRVFYRDVLPRSWPRDTEAGFLLLTLGGSLRSLWSLQSNAAIMACVLFAAAAIVRAGWWRAAWLLALPIYIKVWPAIVAGLLGVHWPKKLIGRGIVACAALACIPFLTKLPSQVGGYYQAWIDCLARREAAAVRFTGYRDGWTIWEQFSSPVNPHAYFMVQAAGGLATLAWCVWIGRRLNRRQLEIRSEHRSQRTGQTRGFSGAIPADSTVMGSVADARTTSDIIINTLAAWSIWQLLLGPGTERLTYLIVAPFAAWAIVASHIERRNVGLATAAFITTFVLGSGGIERVLVRWVPAATAIQPIGIILFSVWLTRHAVRPDRQLSAPNSQSESIENAPPHAIHAAA